MGAPIVIHANAFVSRWFLRPERRDEFIEIFNGLWRGHEAQMGEVTNFVFYGWGRDPNEFVAIESWQSEDITNAVRQTEKFKTDVAKLMACCNKPMVMEVYSPWEGPRDLFSQYPVGASAVHPKVDGIGAVFV